MEIGQIIAHAVTDYLFLIRRHAELLAQRVVVKFEIAKPVFPGWPTFYIYGIKGKIPKRYSFGFRVDFKLDHYRSAHLLGFAVEYP